MTFRDKVKQETQIGEAKLTHDLVYGAIHDSIMDYAWETPMKDSPEEVLTNIIRIIAKELLEELKDNLKSGYVEDDESSDNAIARYEKLFKAKVKIS